MDGVGIGALADASLYGDPGAHTLKHILEKKGGLPLPHFESLGLGHIDPLPGISSQNKPLGSYGKMSEISPGKDTATGHWEMMGIHLKKAFATFPHGFPQKLISDFIEQTGVGNILANKAASGTEIIKELGQEHLETEFPIVYTSADSVFQIACHEERFPIQELYHLCEIARRLCDSYQIGRVIARPFTGDNPSSFKRTADRKDYAIALPEPMLLNKLQEANINVIAIGKIADIFNHQGIATSIKTKSNLEGLRASAEEIEKLDSGLVFTNLVDFDQLYGHRNDVDGFFQALQEMDQSLPKLMHALGEDGILMISSDHGNDPTFPGTDHTREYVPLLVYGKKLKSKNLGTRASFSDLGQTLADIFEIAPIQNGKSFWQELS